MWRCCCRCKSRIPGNPSQKVSFFYATPLTAGVTDRHSREDVDVRTAVTDELMRSSNSDKFDAKYQFPLCFFVNASLNRLIQLCDSATLTLELG